MEYVIDDALSDRKRLKIGKHTVVAATKYESLLIKVEEKKASKCATWRGETETHYFGINYFDGKIGMMMGEREMMLPFEKLIIIGTVNIEDNPDWGKLWEAIIKCLGWEVKPNFQVHDYIRSS